MGKHFLSPGDFLISSGPLGLLLICLLVACDSRFERRLKEATSSSPTIDLAQVEESNWDELAVFGPYMPSSEIQKEVGLNTESIGEGECLWVFIKDDKTLNAHRTQRRYGDCARIDEGARFTRPTAVFDVTEEGGWTYLYIKHPPQLKVSAPVGGQIDGCSCVYGPLHTETDNSVGWININRSDTKLKLESVSGDPLWSSLGSATIVFSNANTSVTVIRRAFNICSERETCEVVGYEGAVTVTVGSQKITVPYKGSCGC